MLKTKISAKTTSLGVSQGLEKSQNSCKIKQKNSFGAQIGSELPPWGHVKGLSEILTQSIIGPSIFAFWMSSFSFWVYVVLEFTQKKQQHCLIKNPIGLVLGYLGAVIPVSNIRLSCNFHHRQFSQFDKYHLKDFEKF